VIRLRWIAARKGSTGRPRKLLQRDTKCQPVSVEELALSLPGKAWKKVSWRQGVKQKLQSRFAAMRVRPAHRDYWRSEPHPEQWLLIEWPTGESEPTKYWLATVPADIALVELVHLAKHRWIIERDYQELKQELGLGHYEGRGWRGFHHHATLCIAAYGFLVAERSRFSPLSPRRPCWITSARIAARLLAARFAAFVQSGIIRVRSRR
jgi:SRSO17 transposase